MIGSLPPMLFALFEGDPEFGGIELPFTRREVSLEQADGGPVMVVDALRWRLSVPASHAALLSPHGAALVVYPLPRRGVPGDVVSFGERSLVAVPIAAV